jgi:hypothetical protein
MNQRDANALLDSLLPRDRSAVIRKRRIVQEVDSIVVKGKAAGHPATPLIEAYAAGLKHLGMDVSPRLIYRWRLAYHRHGLDGLIDRRQLTKGRRPSRQLPMDFLKIIEAHWNTNAGGLLKASIRFELAYGMACIDTRESRIEQCSLRDAELWFFRKQKLAKQTKGKGRSKRL